MNHSFTLVLLLSLPALGHEPEGQIFPLNPCHSDQLNTFEIDGEIDDEFLWEIVPGLKVHPALTSDEIMRNAEGEAPTDFYSEIYVCWEEWGNRLQLREFRWGDPGKPLYSFAFHVDVSHKEKPELEDVQMQVMYYHSPGYGDSISVFSYPRTSWHLDQVEVGHSQTEKIPAPIPDADDDWSDRPLYIESSWPVWEVLGDDEESSVRAILEPDQIIGLSFFYHDHIQFWTSWGHSRETTADFEIKRYNDNIQYLTAVKDRSWGSVKKLLVPDVSSLLKFPPEERR